MRFQISQARCERGNNKTSSGLTSGAELMIKYRFLVLYFVSFKVLLLGVQRGLKYRYLWGLYSKAWHLAATNLQRNKIFTRSIFRICISLKLNCLFAFFVSFNLSTWDMQWPAYTSVPHPDEPRHCYWRRTCHLPCRNWCYRKQGEIGYLFKNVLNFVFRRLNHSYSSFCCAECLCCRGGHFAVLSDGSFLLDVRRRNLPLLICCQSLQHRGQHAGISSDFLG